MNFTYDYPLQREVILGTAQAAVSVPGITSVGNRVQIIGAAALVGASPAAVTISIGDGTTAARYGTITVASGGTANESADITLNLTDDAYEIIDLERLVFTNTTAPANSVAGMQVFVGYY